MASGSQVLVALEVVVEVVEVVAGSVVLIVFVVLVVFVVLIVFVIVVITVVAVEVLVLELVDSLSVVDLQRGDLSVGLEEGLVIGVEGVGERVRGGDDRRVILAVLVGACLEVPLQ